MTKQEIEAAFSAIDTIQSALDSLTAYVASIEAKPKRKAPAKISAKKTRASK